MSKKLIISFLLVFSILLGGCNLNFLKKKKAALQVNSNVKATIFLNDNHVGQTPYFDDQLNSGEFTLKLVPDSSSLLSWQGIIKLSPGIMTVVNRNLAEREEKTSGYILTLEPISEKDKTMMSIVGTPDGVVVNLDGEPRGFAPLSLDNIPEGERLVKISSPGFKEESIKAKAFKGYKLVLNVQLGKESTETTVPNNEASPSASPANSPAPSPSRSTNKDVKEASDSGIAKPYIEVKDTPTGFLKVRSEPSTSSEDNVLTKIKPGEKYSFVESNDNGWYKIEYEKGKQGWVSAKYATLVR